MEVVQRSRFEVAPYQYLARTGSGHTPSRSVDAYWAEADIPWLTTGDVKHLRSGVTQVLNDTEHHISQLGMANSAARLHPAGTVALSRTASVGFSVIMGVDMATSQDFVTWTPGEQLESRYLLWVLRAMKGTGDLDSLMYGSTHNTIYVPDLQRLRGPVPPLEVQRRIADYLDTETARIDTLIAKNEQAAALIDERRYSYLECSFWDVSFPRRRLGTVCDPRRPIRYGIVLPGPSVDDGVPLIKGGDVHRGTLEQGTECRVDRELEAQHRRSRVVPGDLVYTIRGSFGEVAAVPEGLPFANLTQDVARIAPHGVERDWLRHVLDAPSARLFAEVVATGATIRGVNIGDLRMMEVPVPPRDVRRELVREADEVTSTLVLAGERLEDQRRLLRERRQALITAAVTGEIEV